LASASSGLHPSAACCWCCYAVARFISRQASLQTLATTDGLTQLANRRHFDEVFIPAIERQRNASQPLAFILLDIDHFKLYNDQYGHYAGDMVLKRVAHVLQDTFKRKGVLPARLGGEEFGVLMPGTSMQDAVDAAKPSASGWKTWTCHTTAARCTR
jgi:diguanylate cyclase (GGDEF)-like protein